MKKTLMWSMDFFCVGGGATYAMRMFEWAHKRNWRNVLILERKNDIDITWKPLLKKYEVEVYYRNPKSVLGLPRTNKGTVLKFRNDEVVIGIAIFCEQYLNLQYISLRYRDNIFKNYFYALSPYSVGKHDRLVIKNKFIRKNLIYKPLNLSNRLLLMDEDSKNYFEDYFGLNYNNQLFPLGFEIKNIDLRIIQNRTKNKKDKFIILTIGRIDFPFKAYIIKAIDTYVELKKYEDNIELYIIGEGKDDKLLSERLEKLSPELRLGIKRVGKVPYNELEKYMDRANIMIALGTCVLDGAARGLPSSVAVAYQYRGKSIGLFNKCKSMGEVYNKTHNYVDEFKVIKEVYHMTEEEYKQLQLETYKLYFDTYSLNRIMRNIWNIKSSRVGIRGTFIIYMYGLYKKIFDVLCRIEERLYGE